MNKILSKDKAEELLHSLQKTNLPTAYDPEKHRIAILDEAGNAKVYFRLPITLTASVVPAQLHYVILLIQSGNCALGYFENGRNLNHKVFRSYMVRKKQGKSQIKYLKTKGKSRAGSRVRLGETVEFFENINERLQQYFEHHDIHRIAISCSKTLIPYLFGSKAKTPFDKNDPRLLKIPKHIHTPIYEVLLDANKFLLKGELIYDEAQQELIDKLLPDTGTAEDVEEYEYDDEFDDEEDPDNLEEDDEYYF
ncbi:hypothetical protein [Pontibacter sp. H249]|uniref:hypothetical protein n=1 Tax=Pontibacter sp. H249 TaxID=3133420 RepID=UPI0030C54ADC